MVLALQRYSGKQETVLDWEETGVWGRVKEQGAPLSQSQDSQGSWSWNSTSHYPPAVVCHLDQSWQWQKSSEGRDLPIKVFTKTHDTRDSVPKWGAQARHTVSWPLDSVTQRSWHCLKSQYSTCLKQRFYPDTRTQFTLLPNQQIKQWQTQGRLWFSYNLQVTIV